MSEYDRRMSQVRSRNEERKKGGIMWRRAVKGILIALAILTVITLVVGAIALGCNLTNPQVEAGEFGYVTNEPIWFGEKGGFLGIIVGPSSYGLGWRNQIKHSMSYKPFTIEEYFSPIGGVGENKETDTRIMSKDKINMELAVSVVLAIRESPATGGDLDKFKLYAREYVENFMDFWPDRYKKPFRAYVRDRLRRESYSSAMDSREKIAEDIKTWCDNNFEDTPLECRSIQVSNINPPPRMLAEQELKKATEIARDRQAVELELQKKKKDVLDQEATNLQSALGKAPQLLQWRDLEIKKQYAESFNNLVTGEESKTIDKVIFMPYGTPVAAEAEANK